MLLPNEPRIPDFSRQHAFTERYLLPAMSSLEACFLAIRHMVDEELGRRELSQFAEPYPIGRCLEISQEVKRLFKSVSVESLEPTAAAGLAVVREFTRAGGTFRLVWGDLRGQYFQNAFQLGSLYVDVSNDTVVITKPKVEILPFGQAKLAPITDYAHFAQIARNYWECECHANYAIPSLAPYFPLVAHNDKGGMRLESATSYMLALTKRQEFRLSEDYLANCPMPGELFERICRLLRDAGHEVPATPEVGRQQALKYCREYRAKRWAQQGAITTRMLSAVSRINAQLLIAAAKDKIAATGNQMARITIDNVEYPMEQIPDIARSHLSHIQFIDQEIARLQSQIAVLQTARQAYAKAVRSALPAPDASSAAASTPCFV